MAQLDSGCVVKHKCTHKVIAFSSSFAFDFMFRQVQCSVFWTIYVACNFFLKRKQWRNCWREKSRMENRSLIMLNLKRDVVFARPKKMPVHFHSAISFQLRWRHYLYCNERNMSGVLLQLWEGANKSQSHVGKECWGEGGVTQDLDLLHMLTAATLCCHQHH